MPNVVIKPSGAEGQNTYIEEDDPNTNNGTAGGMVIQGEVGQLEEGLIAFDLDEIPLNATIVSAKLGLYCSDINTEPSFRVIRCITGWIWDEVTWNTGPYRGTGGVDAIALLDSYVEVDVTAIVQDWINKTNENYGFHIVKGPCEGSYIVLNSSYCGQENQLPYLDITYTSGPVPGPAVPQAHASTHKEDGSDPIAKVTVDVDGLMSAEDKAKLDGIEYFADDNNISDANAALLTGGSAITIHTHDLGVSPIFIPIRDYITYGGGVPGFAMDTAQAYAWVTVFGAAQNDYVCYNVFLNKGTYTLYLLHTQYSNRGIVTVYIDPVGTGPTTSFGTIDLFGFGTTYNVQASLASIVIATSGLKRVTFKMATKNGSSTGYYMVASSINFVRTA